MLARGHVLPRRAQRDRAELSPGITRVSSDCRRHDVVGAGRYPEQSPWRPWVPPPDRSAIPELMWEPWVFEHCPAVPPGREARPCVTWRESRPVTSISPGPGGQQIDSTTVSRCSGARGGRLDFRREHHRRGRQRAESVRSLTRPCAPTNSGLRGGAKRTPLAAEKRNRRPHWSHQDSVHFPWSAEPKTRDGSPSSRTRPGPGPVHQCNCSTTPPPHVLLHRPGLPTWSRPSASTLAEPQSRPEKSTKCPPGCVLIVLVMGVPPKRRSGPKIATALVLSSCSGQKKIIGCQIHS